MESFDRELFMELCKKYNVEMSETVSSPMINDKYGTHAIGEKDIRRIFSNIINDEREVSYEE